jgi:hypothetical protein
MTGEEVYVIIGETDAEYNFKPITIYAGMVPTNFATEAAEWTVTGDLLKSGKTYIFFNATGVVGFDYEVATGFIATLGKRGVVSAYYDDYNLATDYYYYGATAFQVKGYDLLVGDANKPATALAYNFKPEANAIYITIDGQIVDERALTYGEFQDAMIKAYGDGDADVYNETIGATKYIPFYFDFAADTEVKAETLSTWMSTKPTVENDNYGSYYFKLKNPHNNLLAGIDVYTAIVEVDDKLVDIRTGLVCLEFPTYEY